MVGDRAVGPFEAVVRPKGLGLGATVAASQSARPAGDGEEELRMAPGAYVLVTIGKEKGNYGQVRRPPHSGSVWLYCPCTKGATLMHLGHWNCERP